MFVNYPSTYPSCPLTQINIHVFVLKTNSVVPELSPSRDKKDKILYRVLTFFVSFVNAYSERTINFKSAISSGHRN